MNTNKKIIAVRFRDNTQNMKFSHDQLVEFVNKNNITKEDIVSINETAKLGETILYYYG